MLLLTPAELRALDGRGLADLLERRDCVVAIGDGELRGTAAAAFLFADYAALRRGATVHLDCAAAWAAAVWRKGSKVWLNEQLADEIIDGDDWFEHWMSHRSAAALDAAAMLIRSRGGDPLERAEFARLFATGEPAEGLAAFLAKRRPSFTLQNGRTS
jgi:hypothetical protein